ncbi:MAG TPA: hypothetical protein V6D11_16005 [Waterburya sp.]
MKEVSGNQKKISYGSTYFSLLGLPGMREKFQFIVPAPPPPADIFAAYQLAHQFYREAYHRQEHERYCEWYRLTAEGHRQEFQKLQGDINLFGWLCRRSPR